MNIPLLAKSVALAGLLSLVGTGLKAQGCTNTSAYPFGAIVPDPLGAVTTISTCSYLSEYSEVGPAVAGGQYTFTVTGGGYVTVREGTFDGPVVVEGFSPVVATATAADNLFAHWTVDAQCTQATGCQTTTVQFMLDCTPPAANVVAVDDCDNNQFSLTVNVTGLGDGTSVDLVYSVNGGADQTLPGVQLGAYDIGPFTVGEVIDLTVAHSSDPMCNRHYNGLMSGNTCPTIIQCGGAPLDQSYCYVDNDNNHWYWESAGGEALIAIFSAGSIESSVYDHIRFYDGIPGLPGVNLIWENTLSYPGTDLTGLQIISATGQLYMENTSEGSGSCGGGGYLQWVWQVGCLDCQPATASYNVITDCDNFQFSVEVTITDLGSDGTLDISADGQGTVLATATANGVYTVGPFTANIPVTITLTNSDNSLCNVHSAPLVNPLCPLIIQCGDPAISDTYCYGISDVHAWHWQAANVGDILSLRFSAGTIQATYGGSDGDNLRIYDGPDNTSPLLFQHTATNTFDLTDLQVTSTGQDIYMEMTSDTYGSCTDGSTTAWEWIVGCADCTAPVATYTVVTDCDNYQFTVDVDITAMGSNPNISITNDGGALPVVASAMGTYTVGPFTANIPVTITLSDDANALCSIHSAALVNPLCATPVVCGGPPLNDTYCYTNNDAHAWHWQSNGGEALIMIFSAGSLESNDYDHLRIYDGIPGDPGVNLLWENTLTYPGTDLTGLQVISATGHLYMANTSEGYGSCADGGYNQWVWQVGCLDCTPPQATYTVVNDCAAMQYSVIVNVTVLGSDPVVDITNDGGALPLSATAEGTYTVGPFAAGSTVVITLENDVNPLCSVHSAAITNPLCPTIVDCGGATVNETYCYTNSDNHAWHWKSSGGQPLAIQFSAGSIEAAAYDHIRIYDGPDASASSPLLFENTLQYPGTDLAGLLQIGNSGDIYMVATSDGSSSCQDGSQTQWVWEVGCLDCTNPGVTFTKVDDCIHHSFSIDVNVDSTGSGSFVRIANSLSTDTLTNIFAGLTTVGPFPMDSTVVLTVMNETNNLCRIFSAPFTSITASCLDSVCAAEAYDYCYTNNDTAWFLYQGTENVPLTIEFLWGHLLADDFVQIFDGPAPTAADLLWQGNLNGNMAGFSINTTNMAHILLMRVVSNGAGSCATGQATPALHWVVQCGAVGVHEVPPSDFSMYPNPTTGQLTIELPMIARGMAGMRIVDITGRTVHQETFNSTGEGNSFDLKGLQSGNYTVTITTNDWVKTQRLQIVH